MGYPVSAKAYLERAKVALVKGDPEGLFYAAFEIRCCVETRQAEYAEALSAYQGTKIRPWKIRDTGQRIRRVSCADRISLFRYDFGEDWFDSYHTPVSNELISFAEKELGYLLHCQPKYRPPEDDWWVATRTQLIDGYRMAWLACQGDSMVPPLWNKKTRSVHPIVLEKRDSNSVLFDLLPNLPETMFQVQISYLNSAPQHWICDL